MTDSQAAVADDMSSRLETYKYDKITFSAAIHGEMIPQGLALPLARLCIVRGIRYHDGFGEELRGVLPLFTRALNARSIMSNRIPDMDDIDDFPYCVWYPETASEETYRKLVHRYPQMASQAGRACAVAGYIDLYKELDILPDVHIAEEAREFGAGWGTVREEVKDYGIIENVVDYGAGHGSSEVAGRVSNDKRRRGCMAIYDHIMAQPTRYDIMNDYELAIRTDAKPEAYLNGDTAVLRSLEIKQEFEPEDFYDNGKPIYPMFSGKGFRTRVFNITEDMNIEEPKPFRDNYAPPTPDEAISLLSTPLPFDLPIVDKDLLICMAAYYGDIDRYVHLRRPKPLGQELDCCVRGIYNNTMFALRWQKQEESPTAMSLYRGWGQISKATTARMIMNNVLSRVINRDNRKEPYLIWYPSVAAASTY